MLKLYHAPRSRSSRFIWLLEELGEPYQIEVVSIRRGDGSGKLDALDPHPHGKVPALVHDDTTVFESIAVALYLTDAFPAMGLGPRIGDSTRGATKETFPSRLAFNRGASPRYVPGSA